ncbi:MAG TPA: CPBP family intramembrane glutamic endopeptidase [Rhizomicrobium sp.]|nr:CPBP family intramembrane glutamic endopeptidase [Rhizomicrobium sp.]
MGFLRRIPAWAEFAIVVGVAFGYFIVSSIVIASSHELFAKTHHSSNSLFALSAIEVSIMAILVPFLWARGWTIARVGLRPSWMDVLYGVGLAIAAYAAYAIIWIMFAASAPDAARDAARVSVVTNGISPAAAIVTPFVNALYEELFVAGYIITALKDKHGEWTAINMSVGVRLAYHLYQGALGVIAIIPLGLIFGVWYARRGRLCPLIIAHAAIDLAGLLYVAKF